MQVCLPALHISLGVFYRLYTLLEQATHELDLAMAREKSVCRQLGGSTFEHYSSLLQKMNKLQEDKDYTAWHRLAFYILYYSVIPNGSISYLEILHDTLHNNYVVSNV